MFTKLYNTLLMSSIWSESSETRILWITMLAAADRDGYIFGSSAGLARIAGIPLANVLEALEMFKNPDPTSSDLSRDPDNQGRLIAVVDGGGRLINYEYYRGLERAEDRRYQMKMAQRRFRDKNRPQRTSDDGNQMSSDVRENHPSEAEAEAEAEAEMQEHGTPASPGPSVSVPGNGAKPRSAPKAFERPTVEAVRIYAEKMGYSDFDPVAFVSYYESVGWKRGKTPMRNWRAGVVSWVHRNQ